MFKMRMFTIAALLLCLFALGCAATEIPEILPDPQTGIYSYTYDADKADTQYFMLVLSGRKDADKTLDITDFTVDNILYYNTFTSDETGKVKMDFVTSSYKEGTMFIGSEVLSAPVLLCYVSPGDVLDVADFELVFTQSEYTVKGKGTPSVYAFYKVKATDSFGYESVFPYSDATIELVGYTGEKISFVQGSNAVLLDSCLEEGTYTVEIEYNDIKKQASFAVKREKSVAQRMVLKSGNTLASTIYMDCFNTVDGFFFNPESVVITSEVTDQYEELMQDLKFIYEMKYPDKSTELMEESGATIQFMPVQRVTVDTSETYELTVTLMDHEGFEKTVKFVIDGVSQYTDEALGLYRDYITAREILRNIDSGDIIISDTNGSDVHYEQRWTTLEQKENLSKAVEKAAEMLKQVDEGTASSHKVGEAKTAMGIALQTFKTYAGNFRPIEQILFEKANMSVAIGSTKLMGVTVIPSKPSEALIYTSEKPEIATVNVKTGAVTGVSSGTTTITASNTDGSIKSTYEITVYVPITSMKYKETTMKMIAGDKITPELDILPLDHTDTITYSSDNKIAKANPDGSVVALKEGSTFVTASSSNGKTAKITINVIEPVFSATDRCIAKHGTTLVLPVTIEKLENIKSLKVTVDYNKNVIKLKQAKDGGIVDGYVDTVISDDGRAVSTWENITNQGVLSGKFVEYEIEVLEQAQLREYEISYKIEAVTNNDADVIWDNNKAKTIIDVGEKDTYTISVNAGNGGTAFGGGEFKFGQEASVRAYPSNTHTFAGWYSGNEKLSTDEEYVFIVTKELSLTAKFTLKGGGGFGGGGGGGGDTTSQDSAIEQVSTVIANIQGGAVEYATEISLYTATPGAYIYYTLDGTTPSASSILYTEPIKITQEYVTICAIAVKTGMAGSVVSKFAYRVENMPEAPPVEIIKKDYAAYIKYMPVTSAFIRPNDAATRYEVVAMLDNIFDVSGGKSQGSFSDVRKEKLEVVNKYADAGIINGYPDGTFGGYNGITRAEMVKILSIMLGMDVSGSTYYDVTLSDISGHWAENHIKAFVAAGYILGYPEGDFRPDKAVTRTEVVTIINRILGVQKISNMAPFFADLPTDFWGYDDIMTAANIPAVNVEENK